MNAPTVALMPDFTNVALFAGDPPARLAFRFTPKTVRTLVPPGTAGTYLLLEGDRPVYVGRSDICLRTRLATHNHLSQATHVLWEVARDSRGACVLEAFWWHQHRISLINKIHPAMSDGLSRCPFCDPRTEAGLANAILNYDDQ